MTNTIAFFEYSTEEDFSYVLEFGASLTLDDREYEVKIKDRASDTTRATLTIGAGLTLESSSSISAVVAKEDMVANWPTGEYSADLIDITGGGHSRIMAVRFIYDLPGKLVYGVRDRKAYINWSPNKAYVTATGGIGPTGLKGDEGDPGTDGDNGWAPILAVVTDGVREVHQVADWTGGEGTKPAVGSYIGASGFVSNIADAKNIRGATGLPGSVTDGVKGGVTVSSSGTVWNPTSAAGPFTVNTTLQLGAFNGSGQIRHTGDNSAFRNLDIDFSAISTIGGAVRFFRGTNSTAIKSISIFRGDNSTTVDHTLSTGATGTVADLAKNGGNVLINGQAAWHAGNLAYPSQAVAEAGAAATGIMSPLRTKQQIDARVGTGAGTLAAGNDSRITGAVQQAAPVMSAPPVITTAQIDQNGVANAAYVSGIDLTGTSDASVQLQVALDAIADRFAILGEGHGGTLLLPEGSVLKVANTLLFEANCPITVRTPGGNRKGAQILQEAATLFKFESDVANPEVNSWQTVYIDGLHIVTRVANSIAIDARTPEMVKIQNIYGYPDPSISGAYWGAFFNGVNIRTSFFQDWYIRNSHNTSVQASIRGAAFNIGSTAGSTDNKYSSVLVQGFNTAWNAVTSGSPAVEGSHFDRCSFVGCNTGFLWVNSHGSYVPPLLSFLNGHMHCFKAWGNFSTVAQLDISHNKLELNGVFSDTEAGITGTNIASAVISNNDMHFLNMEVARSAVVFAGTSERCRVHTNAGILTASPAAIQFLTGANNNSAYNNEFRGTSLVVSDSGLNNVVGVNNRVLT